MIRVAAIQSSNMFATYLQDQFQADYAREELVKEGKLSAKKADEQQEEWEQVRCYSFISFDVKFELPPTMSMLRKR